jgi:hypothetical protein
MLRLLDKSFKLILNDKVIDVADIINNQYILREMQSHEVKNLVILEIRVVVGLNFEQKFLPNPWV